MKSPLQLLALAALCLFHVGCATYDDDLYDEDAYDNARDAYEDAHEDAYDNDADIYVGRVPVVAWGGAGYYGGTYYRSSSAYYGSSYYRRGSGEL